LFCAAPARAADPDTVLVESRVGARHPQEESIVGGFVDGWGSGITHGEPLVRLIERHVSRSAGVRGGLLSRVKAVRDDIDSRKLARRGDWDAIVALLEPLHRALPEYLGSIATEAKTRDAVFEMLALLAKSYHADHRTEDANRIITEILIAFPDKVVSEDMWGPAFARFYSAAASAFQHLRRHKLVIIGGASSPPCTVYVNEFRVGPSPRVEAQVPSGNHRVFIDCGGGRQSRVTELGVSGETVARVDFEFDSALDAEGTHAALGYRTIRERDANEVRFASRLGRALRAKRVVTVGVIPAEGNLPALVGRVIDPTSESVLVAHVMTLADKLPTLAEAQELGEKLRSKHSSRGTIVASKPLRREEAPRVVPPTPLSSDSQPRPVLTPQVESKAGPTVPPATAPATISTTPRRRLPAWPGWAAVGAGAGVVALGAAFLALDGAQACSYPDSAPAGIQCPTVYSTLDQGAAYTTVGAVLVVSGVAWGIANTVRGRPR
jgi:hypothetical protein